MNRAEIAKVLTTAASYDRRTLSDEDVIAWHATIGDLPVEPCIDAVVQHYSTSREWLMPADVRRIVEATRLERLRSQQIPAPPPEVADDPKAYLTWRRQMQEEIASGSAAALERAREEKRARERPALREWSPADVVTPGGPIPHHHRRALDAGIAEGRRRAAERAAADERALAARAAGEAPESDSERPDPPRRSQPRPGG